MVEELLRHDLWKPEEAQGEEHTLAPVYAGDDVDPELASADVVRVHRPPDGHQRLGPLGRRVPGVSQLRVREGPQHRSELGVVGLEGVGRCHP